MLTPEECDKDERNGPPKLELASYGYFSWKNTKSRQNNLGMMVNVLFASKMIKNLNNIFNYF
jgi:hypothetical protein